MDEKYRQTAIKSMLARCDCGKEVCAFILFHEDGKVYWNNKCKDHKSDWTEMPNMCKSSFNVVRIEI